MTALIDAHHHVWDLSVRDQDWITGPELAPLRRDFLIEDYRVAAPGVTASIVVQTVTVAGETPELLALAASPHGSPVAGVVGWTDLTAPRCRTHPPSCPAWSPRRTGGTGLSPSCVRMPTLPWTRSVPVG
jgi:predicted TIM-barrel fold metal-dependent hydrolase